MIRSFFAWLRRLFMRKTTPLTNGRRSGRRPSNLGLEFLEDRAVPAAGLSLRALDTEAAATTSDTLRDALTPVFVSTAYQGLLGRAADAGGLEYWGRKVQTGGSRQDVVKEILNSPEYLNGEVGRLYEQRLDRTPAAAERAYWVGVKQAGASWEEIEARILASEEYFQQAGGGLERYVGQMAQDYLHRRVDENTLKYFRHLVDVGTPRETIALQVLASPEANTLKVRGHYRTLLGREGDAGGLRYWSGLLHSGASRQDVLAGILGSDEYAAQVKQFIDQADYTDEANGYAQDFLVSEAKFGLDGYSFNQGVSPLPTGHLVFTENVGQLGSSEAQFVARGRDYSAFLTTDGPVMTFKSVDAATNAERSEALGMTLLGNNTNARAVGIHRLADANFFIGDASNWKTHVAQYKAVKYENVYNGIDLLYQGVDRRLRHDFIVHPGASPDTISFAFPSYDVSVENDGSLMLVNPFSRTTLYVSPPKMFQADSRVVSGGFVALGGGRIGYQVGAYDRNQDLYIDPTLVYSTFVGGSKNELFTNNSGITDLGLALDPSNNAYVVTATDSTNFPPVTGSFATTAPNNSENMVVFKLNAAGTNLVYSTYLGNGNLTRGGDIAVDSSGYAYISGKTIEAPSTAKYPVTPGAFMTAPPGQQNAVVTKLDLNGDKLVYSTYVTGDGVEAYAKAIAIDATGSAYITGKVGDKLNTTAGAFMTKSDPRISGNNENAYVMKMTPDGSGVVYATYITGTAATKANDIKVDSSGFAYISGQTNAANFPTKNAYQSTRQGTQSGFVAKLNPDGKDVAYSTFLGGSAGSGTIYTVVDGLAVDSVGNLYATGYTNAINFPTTTGAFQTSAIGVGSGSRSDAFVVKFNAAGGLDKSTYLGSPTDENGHGIAVDSLGRVYVSGTTNSAVFPNLNPIQSSVTALNSYDAFVTVLKPDFTGLLFSTHLGGLANETSRSLALDSTGAVYVAGTTSSNSTKAGSNGFFPVVNAYQATNNGGNDVYVAKLKDVFATTPVVPPNAPAMIAVSGGNNQTTLINTAFASPLVATVTDNTGSPLPGVLVTFAAPGSGASATINGGNLSVLTDTNGQVSVVAVANGNVGTYTVTASVAGLAPVNYTLTNFAPFRNVVSTNDIYEPNQTSDRPYSFGTLPRVTIQTYQNLEIGATPNRLPDYDWFKWTMSSSGTFYAQMTTLFGGPLEMHLFILRNNVLTEVSNTLGGVLSTGVVAGQPVYVEVKGQNTSTGVLQQGVYTLDVSLN